MNSGYGKPAFILVYIPSGQDLRRITDSFESKWNFLQCVGAIDGAHLLIISPKVRN